MSTNQDSIAIHTLQRRWADAEVRAEAAEVELASVREERDALAVAVKDWESMPTYGMGHKDGEASAQAEVDQLRAHILDIDAHATPYGDIPDEPGWVGAYLVTAGALHRALGKIGHSAPSCTAEARVEQLEGALHLLELHHAMYCKWPVKAECEAGIRARALLAPITSEPADQTGDTDASL